jgi:hypothetical protein
VLSALARNEMRRQQGSPTDDVGIAAINRQNVDAVKAILDGGQGSHHDPDRWTCEPPALDTP